MTRTYDFGEATVSSGEYLWRYFVAGLFGIPFAMTIVPSPAISLVVLLHNFVSAIIVFPGAVLLSFVRLRSFSTKLRPSLWVAALVAVTLTWAGYGAIAFGDMGPSEALRRMVGPEWAWVLHVAGWNVIASSLGLTCGWVMAVETGRILTSRH